MKKKMLLLFVVLAVFFTGCGEKEVQQEKVGVDELVAKYGYQWTDVTKPILNEKGSEEISFNIYSSKNASALDYNDMLVMQNLYESTGVNVMWENVSESVYLEQKNLIFGNVLWQFNNGLGLHRLFPVSAWSGAKRCGTK